MSYLYISQTTPHQEVAPSGNRNEREKRMIRRVTLLPQTDTVSYVIRSLRSLDHHSLVRSVFGSVTQEVAYL